jgi:dihydroorotate dehydrogenase
MREEQIMNLSKSELSGIVLKTCTLEPRTGNPLS